MKFNLLTVKREFLEIYAAPSRVNSTIATRHDADIQMLGQKTKLLFKSNRQIKLISARDQRCATDSKATIQRSRQFQVALVSQRHDASITRRIGFQNSRRIIGA